MLKLFLMAALCSVLLMTLFLTMLYIGGRLLIQRRPPDPADDPSRHGMAYEVVSFPSRYKANLRGWWIPYEEQAQIHQGTLIFCHGQNGSMAGDLPLAARLHAIGYNLLLFDLRAHGESEGKYLTYGVFEKEDLLGAVDFLVEEKGIKSVGVIGFSMGASVAMIGAALTDKISVLVVDGIYWKFIDLVQTKIRQRVPEPFALIGAQIALLGASILSNTRMYQVSPMLWAKHLEGVPTLFIHAEQDRLIPLEAVQKLAADLAADCPHDIWVAADCDHREAFQKHEAEYVERVAAWLAQHPPHIPKAKRF